MLTQSRQVLSLMGTTSGCAHFSSDGTPVGGETETHIHFSLGLWRDMGEPEAVTLSIVPGDGLNVSDS